jgi:putative transposase
MFREPYDSDVTDVEWLLLEPLIPPEKHGGRHRTVDIREVVNAIFYVLRTGCAWRLLPHDFPAWQTVYGYFRDWRKTGVWEQLNTALREAVREQEEREAEPSGAIWGKVRRVLGVGEGLDSFISHKPALPNLDRIREVGLETYLEEQRERLLLVEQLLADYNEGRSMSFYCAACALMPPDLVRQAIGEMEGVQPRLGRRPSPNKDGSDLKAKAKAMRTAIQNLASQAGIDLKLRKKK